MSTAPVDVNDPLTRTLLTHEAAALATEHDVRLSDMLLDVGEGEDTPAARIFHGYCRDNGIEDSAQAATAILAELDAVDAESVS